MIKVVAALIEKEGKVLIAKRNEGSNYTNGKWEFPGGKVELNENEFDAIQREIKEELSVDINPSTIKLFGVLKLKHTEKQKELL